MKKRLDVDDAFHFIIQISGVPLHHCDLLVFLSKCATCEKDKALAGREPTNYSFESQRPTPTPRRPGVSCISYYCREEQQVGVVQGQGAGIKNQRSWVRAPPALCLFHT